MESLPNPLYKPDIFSNPPKNIANNFKVKWIKNRLSAINFLNEKKMDLGCQTYKDGEEIQEAIGLNYIRILDEEKEENLSEKDTASIDSQLSIVSVNGKARQENNELKKRNLDEKRSIKHYKKFDYWTEYNQMKIQNS